MQGMLTYIHEHYMENILLKDIAAQANVSEGECLTTYQTQS